MQPNAIDPESGWRVAVTTRRYRPFGSSELERRTRTSALALELYMATRDDLGVAKLEWEK